ncbi:MAG: hypothetical protein IK115_06165 [Lachnospiraceae bacterium]|nr:hypothetical protein [Lachnospiraceae bacterium]
MDFENISSVDAKTLKEKLSSLSKEIIVKARIGTSPENAAYLSSVFEEIDFEKESKAIGRIRIEEVDAAQQEILKSL